MVRSQADGALRSSAAQAGALAIAYFAGAELGHALSFEVPGQSFATFWPPAGLLIAALVLTRPPRWGTLLLAACAANAASDVLLHGKSVAVSLGFCLANCSEACLGAWLIQRFVGLSCPLATLKDVLGLASFSAVISTSIGATIGAATVAIAFSTPFWWTWQMWWIADAVAVLVVAPMILTWAAERANLGEILRSSRGLEYAALLLGTMLATEAVYGGLLPAPLNVPALVLPFLLWSAFRFGPPAAAATIFVIAMVGIWQTSQGRGPYAALAASPSERLLRGQATLCVISLSVLALAATVAERKEAERQRTKLIAELEQALAEIRTLRGLIPVCAWCKKIRNDQGFWQGLEEYLHAHTEAEFTHGLCPECLEMQLGGSKRSDPGRKNV